MLPSILVKQLHEGLNDYIETTFPMTTPVFKGSIKRLLDTKESIFHEPYFSVHLPFRVSEREQDNFESIQMPYKPYVHQQIAFDRLAGEDGRSTLIATGTGSGKTECFTYPILEYCYKHRGERGIKALVIYPMNALASDQAKRLAEAVYKSDKLKNNITVGMYVGGHEESANRIMGIDHVITDKETMLSSPPDILLTNYKMLDYLLVRPKDAELWKDNDPDTLKYIAVDELHTFDGAQGTDLACLLRRLKSRLYIQPGYLCCIGTSATMGDVNSSKNILSYAKEIFGETFEVDSVVIEDRLSSYEFFDRYDITDFKFPSIEDIEKLTNSVTDDELDDFLVTASSAWISDSFGDITSDEDRVKLGEALMHHSSLQSLLDLYAGKYAQTNDVVEALIVRYPELKELPDAGLAIDALIALVSHARTNTTGNLRPFLTVQVHLWMKELTRLLAKVSDENITYAIASDLNEEQSKHYLPIVNCRECGETGWASIINERGNTMLSSLEAFYNSYFDADEKVVLMYPYENEVVPYNMVEAKLCPTCLKLDVDGKKDNICSECGEQNIPVVFPRKTDKSKNKRGFSCPHCGSKTGLSIMGLRSATAISAGISQMFVSQFNDDKKTLTFSDNVQDAAYRAGFFNSRTWKFGIRNSIQKYVLDGGDGLSLIDFSNGFVEYWHTKYTDEEFVSRFIAPNMVWMRAFEKMKRNGVLGTDKDAKKLMTDIEYRLRYEIMLEYGILSKIGRTLPKSNCSSIQYDKGTINETAKVVQERITNELNTFRTADIHTFESMVVTFLDQMRLYGAFRDNVFNMMILNNEDWHISNDCEKWMPGKRNGRNVPKFLYQPIGGKPKKVFNMVTFDDGLLTDAIENCSLEVLQSEALYSEIVKVIVEELEKREILIKQIYEGKYNVWTINKKSVYITSEVTQLTCDQCGQSISVATNNAKYWDDFRCPRRKCDGTINVNHDAGLGYYGRFFSTGKAVRVSAKEHTGLLERDDREELERVFKRKSEDAKPWDTNVLSCTPTLEMGIDIGDLSSVIMCSIPPGQAQFLQRAGRAGRKDGNALIFSLANARPHDLFSLLIQWK